MAYKVDSFPGREIVVKGKQFLYFGGTAYLGLQTDPAFQNILIKNIKKFGTNYGASRNANVQLPIYEKTERYLANLISSEHCLTLSSGFLAGQMVANYFHSLDKRCFYAPNTHEALHVLGTKNYERYDGLICDLNVETENGTHAILFLDSIALDRKNHPDFDWLQELQLEQITLVVDDSHGFGIVGEKGGGVYGYLKAMKPKDLVVCGSLGKGFGIQAGFLAGSDKTISKLKTTDMFAAASPAGPASIATIMESQEILSEKRQQLLENIEYFISNLSNKSHFNYLPEYPCFSFENDLLSKFLVDNDMVITNFYYPTEQDQLVQRIVLSAHHKKEDILKLSKTINQYFLG